MSKLSEETCAYLNEYCDILERMILGMTSAELGCSISYNFIAQMIPHHKAAVEMSQNILKYTNNSNIKCIAQKIIAEQTAGIKAMEDITECTQKLLNCRRDLHEYQCCICEIMRKMFCCMKNAAQSDCVDKNFLCEMIPHHRGAVQMANEALKYCICPELKAILCDMIASHKRIINQMCCMLKCF